MRELASRGKDLAVLAATVGLLAATAVSCDQLPPSGQRLEPEVETERRSSAVVVQDCPENGYVDRRAAAADRELDWTFSITTDPERCMLIAPGQTVVWDGSLTVHPLDPQGGDVPNPIFGTTTGVVTFNTPGTFGFVCGIHTSMKGAIRVAAPAATSVPALGAVGNPRPKILLAGALLAFAIFLLSRRRATSSTS